VIDLSPGPTNVEYPDFRLFNARTTQDNAVIVQRPLQDDRTRSWIWNGYRPTIPGYQAQWDILAALEARRRLQAGRNPIIQIWENETGNAGGFGETTDSLAPDLSTFTNIKWTSVKILQATRRIRPGGGVVTFTDSLLEFRIVDPAWENF
jgi:hypothetical protein